MARVVGNRLVDNCGKLIENGEFSSSGKGKMLWTNLGKSGDNLWGRMGKVLKNFRNNYAIRIKFMKRYAHGFFLRAEQNAHLFAPARIGLR